MAHELVHDVGLRGVQRLGVVPDVLGAKEGAEREAVQEVPAREQARHGTQRESRPALQEARKVFLLRHVGPVRVTAEFRKTLGQRREPKRAKNMIPAEVLIADREPSGFLKHTHYY